MKNTIIDYQNFGLQAMEKIDPIVMDHIWSLWNNLCDSDTEEPSVVEACVYMIENYGFDIDCLPENLCGYVKKEMQEQAEDSYWMSEAMEEFC